MAYLCGTPQPLNSRSGVISKKPKSSTPSVSIIDASFPKSSGDIFLVVPDLSRLISLTVFIIEVGVLYILPIFFNKMTKSFLLNLLPSPSTYNRLVGDKSLEKTTAFLFNSIVCGFTASFKLKPILIPTYQISFPVNHITHYNAK